jgi:helix-turn-helix, Psq domain
METAVGNVIGGSISQREAAKRYYVPRATLQKIIKGKMYIGAKPGKKCLFGVELETKLVDYASNRADLGVGFGKNSF